MLNDLPTAHHALSVGHRLAGHDGQGLTRFSGRQALDWHAAHVHFVYVSAHEAYDPCAAYHQHLVRAEVLLDRVVAAYASGLRPLAPELDDACEARATVRPPRSQFSTATLEYRRWYDDHGAVRPQPLTQEALVEQLVASGVSMRQALDRAIHRSHALRAADQLWLIRRRASPLGQRPLNGSEFRSLVDALDAAWQAPAGARHVAWANRRVALRVAEALAGLLDEYVAPPFAVAALNEAFSTCLLARLRRTIEASRRRSGSACGVLLVGPNAWFAAKATRMRAEHQIGLALMPRTQPLSRPRRAGGTTLLAAAG